jgi:hypothetical protein
MPDNRESSDFARSLRLEFPAAQKVETLRGQGLRAKPPETKSAQSAAPTAETGRPLGVTLIALYEFVRAAFLIAIYLLVAHNRGPQAAVGTSVAMVLMPVSICYAIAIGVCLWLRVNWARRVLIATSCYSVYRIVRFQILYSAIATAATDRQMAQFSSARNTAYLMVAFNVLIGLYLAFAPGVAEAFGQEE